MVLGEKQYETRSWPTWHRGLLAIHVSKKYIDGIWMDEPFFSTLKNLDLAFYPGCIIGTVEVVFCMRMPLDPGVSNKETAFGDWTPGRFAWQLANPRRLAAPIACRGMRGLWNVPPEIEAQMTEVAA